MELTTGSASMTRPICRQSKCNLAEGLVPRDPREEYRFAKRITHDRERPAHRGSRDSGVEINEIKKKDGQGAMETSRLTQRANRCVRADIMLCKDRSEPWRLARHYRPLEEANFRF